MNCRRLKPVWFALEGLNGFGTSYFFYYLFFFLRDQFGFGNKENLAVCAVHGLVYTFASWFSGRFSQRAGYLVALPLGFGVMGIGTLGAGLVGSRVAVLVGLILWTLGMSLTWPTLEALVSEAEPPGRLQRMIGIYNLVWAGASAIAYFVGGVLKEGLGDRSIFWLPAMLSGVQLLLLFVLKRKPSGAAERQSLPARGGEGWQPPAPPGLKVSPKGFLLMAWLANPFAYMTINVVGPVIPQLAERLNLTTQTAGFFCSIWLFARLATFACLWRWSGWHYRFRWLLGAFVLMTVSFAGMLLASRLALIVLAQVGLGCGVGLIYYSSLFYSMDVGETKGEHGGIHEAVIGSGVFGGAAIGSAGQYLLQGQSSCTLAVSAVLLLGLVSLVLVRRRYAVGRQLLVVGLLFAGLACQLRGAQPLPAGPSCVVHSNGAVTCWTHPRVLDTSGMAAETTIRYDFGLPTRTPESQRLEGGGLPICRSTWEEGGIRYSQCVLMTRLEAGEPIPEGGRAPDAVLMVQLTGENKASQYTNASARIKAWLGQQPVDLDLRGDLVYRRAAPGPGVLAAFDIPAGGVAAARGQEVGFGGNMPPGTSGAMTLKLPLLGLKDTNQLRLLRELEFDEELKRVRLYWLSRSNVAPAAALPVTLAGPEK